MSRNLFQVPTSVKSSNFKSFFTGFCSWKKGIDVRNQIIIFDFTNTVYIEPVAAVFFSSAEDQLTDDGFQVTIRSQNNSPIDKFLRVLGIKRDLSMNLTDFYEQNSSRYSVKVQRCSSTADCKNVTEKVLPQVMKRLGCTREVQAGLHWGLIEILDNAGVHGYQCYHQTCYPLPVYVCAFSYKNRVEIAILDRGQGIQQSLRSTYQNVGDRELLRMATHKGISGHPNGSPGFGLYGSRQIAKIGAGTFNLWSGGYGLSVSANSEGTFAIPGFTGTMATIALNSGSNFALDSIINRDVDDFFEDFGLEEV